MKQILQAIDQGFRITFLPAEDGGGLVVEVMLECEDIARTYVHSTTIEFPNEKIKVAATDAIVRLVNRVKTNELCDRYKRL